MENLLQVFTTTAPSCACKPGYIACDSCSKCVPESKVCDGSNQCEDMSDERGCSCAYNGEMKEVGAAPLRNVLNDFESKKRFEQRAVRAVLKQLNLV